jgi:hypothetical protein
VPRSKNRVKLYLYAPVKSVEPTYLTGILKSRLK